MPKKNELMVFEKRGQAFTTSDIIAEGTGNSYRSVQRLIETHKTRLERHGQVRFQITPVRYSRGMNEKKVYILNERQATSLMVYLGNSERVLDFKDLLVDEFFRMRDFIREKQSIEWQEARQLGKPYRRAFTDAIQAYVHYCTECGSKNGSRYYVLLTNMINTAVGCEAREKATKSQIAQIAFIEDYLSRLLFLHLAQGTEYHEIFTDCKTRVYGAIAATTIPLLTQ